MPRQRLLGTNAVPCPLYCFAGEVSEQNTPGGTMLRVCIAGTAALAFALTGCADSENTAASTTTGGVAATPTEKRATLWVDAPPTTVATSVPAGYVSEATWPGEWPFIVPDGVLNCAQLQRVTFTSNRTIYALNGSATAAGGFDDVAPIW